MQIEKDIKLNNQKQIELAASILAQILVQQAITNRNKQIKIENKHGKSN